MSHEVQKEDRFLELRDGNRLCYRATGDTGGSAIIMVAGLGQQLTVWPRAIVDGLTRAGHLVITLDNRDVGRSSRSGLPAPAKWRLLLDQPLPGAYSLEDMACDVVELADSLQLDHFHLVGQSMGGMIAQVVAATFRSGSSR